MTENDETRQSIRYTVTVDDVVALGVFHSIRSAAAKQTRQRLRVILSAVAGAVWFIVGYNVYLVSPQTIGLWVAPAFGLMAGGVVYGLGSHRFQMPHLLRYMIRKRYAKPDNAKYLGEHSLAIDAQGFTHRTPYTESRYAWGALDRIEAEPSHTYWYVSSCQAIVIPHQKIVEGNFPALLAAVKEHYKPSQTLVQARSNSE
jgi:hypothetical protein